MFDLLKDIIKIFAESIIEFWADLKLTEGTRDFIENDNSKKKTPIICFLATIVILIAASVWGIFSFKTHNYIEGTVAGLFVIGVLVFLIVLKIQANDRKHNENN